MRSSRALQSVLRNYKLSHNVYRGSSRLHIFCNSYCSACDAKSDRHGRATAVTNPTTPPADHRQLAIEQELYINSIYSPGSPLFGPNGARMFNKLTNFLRAQYSYFGFQEVITPTIYKKSLWEKSGHWKNYKDDMYSVTGRGATGRTGGKELQEDEEYGLKPMNCPGHCLIFASKPRSYKELPVRYADFSPLHRNEISGSLSGLTRVRRFHQDDGHIFCRPGQIGEEISKTLEFVRMVYRTLGLGTYRLTLSTRPKDSFIGTVEEWDSAEAALKKSLHESGQVWTINEGDGAFYGPKIDIILKDSDGKEHQTATIQLDFQLPKRFELQYQAPAPELEKKGETTMDPELLATSGSVTPVLIHRAILGSVERLMALLIEHYNGKYPFWLNPRQIIVLTVNDEDSVLKYANSLVSFLRQDGSLVQAQELNENCPARPGPEPEPESRRIAAPSTTHNFAVDLDDTPRSIKKKVRDAKMKHYSVIMVVGQDEATKASVNVDLSGITDSDGWIGKAAHFFSPRGSRRRGDNEVSRNGGLDAILMLNKAGDELGPKELKNVSFENRHDIFDLLVGIQDRYL